MDTCDYYMSYRGPDLVSVLVEGVDDLELHKKICGLYGDNKNWDGKLYKSGAILDNTFKNKTITLKYSPTKTGIENWTRYTYKDEDEYINSPLWAPLSLGASTF